MATTAGEWCRGTPFRTIRDSFVENLKLTIKYLDKRGITHDWIGHAKIESELINIIKGKIIVKGRFIDGNNTHNDEEEDDPSPASALVRMSDEINNNKHDATPGRCLEARINLSRREVVRILSVDSMSRRDVRLRHMKLARKCHPDKWVDVTLAKHKVRAFLKMQPMFILC